MNPAAIHTLLFHLFGLTPPGPPPAPAPPERFPIFTRPDGPALPTTSKKASADDR